MWQARSVIRDQFPPFTLHTSRPRESSALVQDQSEFTADGGPVLKAPTSQPEVFPGVLMPPKKRRALRSKGSREVAVEAVSGVGLAGRLGRKRFLGRKSSFRGVCLPFLLQPPGGDSSSRIRPSGRSACTRRQGLSSSSNYFLTFQYVNAWKQLPGRKDIVL